MDLDHDLRPYVKIESENDNPSERYTGSSLGSSLELENLFLQITLIYIRI